MVKVLFNIKRLKTDEDIFLIEKDNNGYYVQKYFEKYDQYEEILIEHPVDIEYSQNQHCCIEETENGEVRYVLLVPENTVIRNRK